MLASSDDEQSPNDQMDDDGDGKIDCADSECTAQPICVENAQDGHNCFDGLDNDLDGKLDCDDPDCAGVQLGAGPTDSRCAESGGT